jgi:hypothetical protein
MPALKMPAAAAAAELRFAHRLENLQMILRACWRRMEQADLFEGAADGLF